MGTLTSWDLAKKAQVQERKEWIKNACSNIMKRMNQGVLGGGEGRACGAKRARGPKRAWCRYLFLTYLSKLYLGISSTLPCG